MMTPTDVYTDEQLREFAMKFKRDRLNKDAALYYLEQQMLKEGLAPYEDEACLDAIIEVYE